MWCRFLISRYRRPLNLNGRLASYSSKAVVTPSIPPPPPPPPPPNGGHFRMLGLVDTFARSFASWFAGALTGGLAFISYTRSSGLSPEEHTPFTDAPTNGDATLQDDDDPKNKNDDDPSFKYSARDLRSDEAMWALYERWCRHYKIDRTREEMVQRFDGFRWLAAHIYEFNSFNLSYTLALNEFADETLEEMRKGCTFPFPCWHEDLKKLEEESKLSCGVRGDVCSICRQGFCESHPSVVIGCKHEFHNLCLMKWRYISCKCRVCWQPISLKDPTSEEFDESELEKDKMIWTLYERWCRHQGLYTTPEDMHKRFNEIMTVFEYTRGDDKEDGPQYVCMSEEAIRGNRLQDNVAQIG